MLSQAAKPAQPIHLPLPVMILATILIYGFLFAAPSKAQTCTNGTLNVTTYGAQGNGTNDDTSAIQKAINAATVGQCVYLPNGTYKITSALQVGQVCNEGCNSNNQGNDSGFTIYGQSQTGAIISYSCSGCTSGYPMIQLGALSLNNIPTNITIQTLTLEGNSDPTATAGILTNGGEGHTIQELTIQDFPGSSSNTSPVGIHFNGPSCSSPPSCTNGTTNSSILRNTIHNIGTASPSTSSFVAGIRCSWGSSNNTIQGNTITNTGRDGIAGDDYSTHLLIKHNTISGTGDCAASCQSASPPGPALGIELFLGCDFCSVDDNTVDHWISIAESSQCAVRRNTVVNSSTAILGFTGLEFAGDYLWPTMNGVFTSNTVGPASPNGFAQQQVGVSISHEQSNGATTLTNPVSYGYWANNIIQNMEYEGIQMNAGPSDQAGDAGIQYQYFYNNQVINTAYTNNNSNYADPGNGFRLFGSAALDYAVLDTNTINSNGIGSPCSGGVSGGGNALLLGKDVNFLSVVNNTIENNGGAAVAGGGSSPMNAEWSNNTVSGNGCGNNSIPNTGWIGAGNSASFTFSPSNPATGQTVTFTPSYSGSNAIQHVIWDFDDGIPVAPSSPFTQQETHTYQFAGTCHVTLILWDSQGIASRYEQTITVGGGTGNCNQD